MARNPTIPFWVGEAPARTDELSEEVSELRRAVGGILGDARASRSRERRPGSRRRAHVRRSAAGSSARPARASSSSTSRPRSAQLGVLPSRRDIVFERFFDEAGGMQLVRARPLRRARQPRLRPGAAQALLRHLRLRAAGGRQRRRRSCSRSGPSTASRSTARRALLRSETARGRARAGGAGIADVRLALALEPQPLAGGAALPRRQEEPAPHPAHGGRRPHGGGLPGAGRLPGERAAGADRDPRPRARAPDAPRLPARGHGRRRARRACSRSIESGAIRAHFVDSTEPSVLAHEILNGKPYTFLDDAPARGAPHARRAAAPRPAAAGRASSAGSTPPRSSACAPRPRPTCAAPRSCTTSCSRPSC